MNESSVAWPEIPGIPACNIMMAADPHRGLLQDMATGDVWISRRPMGEQSFKQFPDQPGFIKHHFGRSMVDAAWYINSPGCPDGSELISRSFSGEGFLWIARSRAPTPLQECAFVRYTSEWHAIVGFAPGKTLKFLLDPDGGRFIQSIMVSESEAETARRLILPRGFHVACARILRPAVFAVGPETTIYFDFSVIQNFFGPIRWFRPPADETAFLQWLE